MLVYLKRIGAAMEIIAKITDFLQEAGGWGVAVIIGWAYWKKDKQCVEMHTEGTNYIKETTGVLSSLREVIRACHQKGRDDD